MAKVTKQVRQFNKGRDSELLQLKYKKMSKNPFAFFRGSCHLFYRDWSKNFSLNDAPSCWLCGDLHLENFGSYQGDNHLTYFDINDFDESFLAPCTLDIARLLTSIFLAFPSSKNSVAPEALCNYFLNAYTSALIDGKARWVEREIAEGLVKSLLDKQKSKRQEFINQRTVVEANHRKILIRAEKTRLLSALQQEKIKTSLAKFISQQNQPIFGEFVDAAWRIAGTGSLGVERYVVLVEGSDGNYLLDLKLGRESSLETYLDFPQPQWRTQADRIVTIQNRMQAISPALLNVIKIDGAAFVIREYQPTEDRVNLDAAVHQSKVSKFMQTLGQIVAWAQLRSSGRQGSANADELIEFAYQGKWHQEIIKYSDKYSKQVGKDWQNFVKDWQAGNID